MTTKELTIINKLGLHARAAAKLSTLANRFACDINVIAPGKTVNCKSVMSLMLLAATKGTDITLECDGEDEESAMTAIETLINNRFDEDE